MQRKRGSGESEESVNKEQNMTKLPKDEVDRAFDSIRESGCACDVMIGYNCGIHAPMAKL